MNSSFTQYIYINDNPKLILTYFTAISNLAKLFFCTYSRTRYQVSLSALGRFGASRFGPMLFRPIYIGRFGPIYSNTRLVS